MDTYKIMKFYIKPGRKPRKVRGGLTLEAAQAHCNRPEAHHITGPFEKQWFHGYTKE